MIWLLTSLAQLIFIFCVCFAIVSDFRKLTIPNWISLTLVGTFVIYAVANWPSVNILQHLAIAGILFVLGIVFFAMNWLGGGDVKFLTAVALWAGIEHGPKMLLLLCLLGGVFAIGLIALRKLLKYWPAFGANIPIIRNVVSFAKKGVCPYGVPIGISALLTAPNMFQLL